MNNAQHMEDDETKRIRKDSPYVVLLSEGDLPDVLALERLCFEKTWSLEQLRSNFRRGSLFLCGAKNPQGLLGYVAFQIVASDMELLNVAVLPAWRGRGLGCGLVRKALQYAFEQGANACFLEVAVDNTPALNLYRGLGFTTIGVRKNYYKENGRHADAVMMKKELHIAPCPIPLTSYPESEEK